MNNEFPAVKMTGIYKEFPYVVANNQIDFQAEWGTVHALLGENGAGKTTLMNILSGVYKQDKGEIFINGKLASINSPNDAIDLGIGMVRQNFSLVDVLTVTENVILGLKQLKFFLPKQALIADIEKISKEYNLDISPNAQICRLSMGERQRVEIVKLLYRNVDILILDEPTSILTPQQVNTFFKVLRQMAAEGKCVILITHKLDEVCRIADYVTVLRDGKKIKTLSTGEINKKDLAELMVGRQFSPQIRRRNNRIGKAILTVENVSARKDNGLWAVNDVSFELRESEILGIAGVAGNGQEELAEILGGLRPVEKGTIFIKGENTTNFSTMEMINLGMSHIPEDRLGVGLIPSMNIEENLILKNYRKPPLSKGPLIDQENVQKFSEKLIRQFNIQGHSQSTPVSFLSGGNIQRVILAREISSDHSLLIAVHPTSGLDIGATDFVHKQLLDQAEAGISILLISEDLDELLLLSDRIAVMFAGNIMGVVDPDHTSSEEIGLLMAGETPNATAGNQSRNQVKV